MIDLERIRRELAQREPHWAVDVLEECGSTNSVLSERLRAGDARHNVVVAERQTAGRGRRGRAWAAPPESSLVFSLLWDSRRPGTLFGLLPLAAGVACARALGGLGVPDLRLKWPNDLMLPEGKAGGILVESVPCGGHARVIIGVGLNLRDGERLAAELGRPVADLARACPGLAREQILVAVLVEMHRMLSAFEAGRDDEIIRAWGGFDVLRDREIEVLAAGPAVRGVARGIAADGALRVDTAEGSKVVYAGEASIA